MGRLINQQEKINFRINEIRWLCLPLFFVEALVPPPLPLRRSARQQRARGTRGGSSRSRDLHRHIASSANHDRVRHHRYVALLQVLVVLLLLLVDRVEIRHRARRELRVQYRVQRRRGQHGAAATCCVCARARAPPHPLDWPARSS